jgi:SAM-dependent methyltransferase
MRVESGVLRDDPVMVRIGDSGQFRDYASRYGGLRHEFEKFLLENDVDGKVGYPGFCEVCERPVNFIMDAKKPDFREGLVCCYCGLSNRLRFMGGLVKRMLADCDGPRRAYVQEALSPFFSIMKKSICGHDIVGSEFFGCANAQESVLYGVRHEDAVDLSFEDDSFDIVISNDVYEHVPDLMGALGESFRVLKKRGCAFV